MRNDLADITIVVDRSGSMASIKDDAEGGVNSFIAEQAKADGEATLTLVQFDTEYEFVHQAANVKGLPPYKLIPRGGTALLDAVGRAIAETGERLSKMEESQRPRLVAFVIVTDGHENSSKEFTLAKVREAISHQRDQYQWQFTFLGAGESAFQAEAMGIHKGDTSSYSPQNVCQAYTAAAGKVLRSRSLASAGAASLNAAFTNEERSRMA